MNLPTKAIIVAAGEGIRCRPYTASQPKCLLSVNGKSILDHQLRALSANGITSYSLVRGHLAQKFVQTGIRYYDNLNYKQNNILNSLMVAEEELDGDCLVSYGDIVYTADVVEAVVRSSGDITVVVDTNWRKRYVGRDAHPVSEAEKVVVNKQGIIQEIGKHIPDGEAVLGEFIGLMKLTGRGCDLFLKMFRDAKEKYDGNPFQHAKTFQEAYLTDMIQEMIQHKIPVHAALIQGNWVEIDTVEDYEYAKRLFKGASS